MKWADQYRKRAVRVTMMDVVKYDKAVVNGFFTAGWGKGSRAVVQQSKKIFR